MTGSLEGRKAAESSRRRWAPGYPHDSAWQPARTVRRPQSCTAGRVAAGWVERYRPPLGPNGVSTGLAAARPLLQGCSGRAGARATWAGGSDRRALPKLATSHKAPGSDQSSLNRPATAGPAWPGSALWRTSHGIAGRGATAASPHPAERAARAMSPEPPTTSMRRQRLAVRSDPRSGFRAELPQTGSSGTYSPDRFRPGRQAGGRTPGPSASVRVGVGVLALRAFRDGGGHHPRLGSGVV